MLLLATCGGAWVKTHLFLVDYPPPKFNSSPLKNGAWKTSFWRPKTLCQTDGVWARRLEKCAAHLGGRTTCKGYATKSLDRGWRLEVKKTTLKNLKKTRVFFVFLVLGSCQHQLWEVFPNMVRSIGNQLKFCKSGVCVGGPYVRQRRRGSRKDASTSCTCEEGHRSCPTGQCVFLVKIDSFVQHQWICWKR